MELTSRIKTGAILTLTVVAVAQFFQSRDLRAERDRQVSRAKAYETEMDSMATTIIAHEVTLRELTHSWDLLSNFYL